MRIRAHKIWWLAIVLIGCDGNSVGVRTTSTIDPPSQCSSEELFCFETSDFPDDGDLNSDNSGDIRFSDPSDGLVIKPGNSLPDTDGDGVPDDADDCPSDPSEWRGCDGDPTNDGIFHTLFYDSTASSALSELETIDVSTSIDAVDLYFLIDGSRSMDEEIAELQANFYDIVSAIDGVWENPNGGVGLFRDYSLSPLETEYTQAPYHHILDLTDDLDLIVTAVNSLNTAPSLTRADASSQALYSIATGNGLGSYVPNRDACPTAGRWGYPCFREGSLPIVIHVTDDDMYNGPLATGPTYGNPPFDGVEGLSADLPPVRMPTDLLYADDGNSALEMGDIAGDGVTLMGMTTLFNNSVNSANVSGCVFCGMLGCWTDWKDAVVHLTMSTASTYFITSDNTHLPGAFVSIYPDSAGPGLAPGDGIFCNEGPGSGDRWGGFGVAPAAGSMFYITIDGFIPTINPSLEPEGAFQLAIWDVAAPTTGWATQDAPIAWIDTETQLIANNMVVGSVVTPANFMLSTSDALDDALALATAIGSEDSLGDEYVQTADFDGTGVTTAVANLINQIGNLTKHDISIEIEDDLSTTIDERDFVSVMSTSCAAECTGSVGSTCTGCDPHKTLSHTLLFNNSTVTTTGSSQVFNFEIVILADGVYEVERIPVRILVPADPPNLNVPAFYGNEYNSTDTFCNTPPDRPDWGTFTWSGTIVSDSTIEFQFYTASTEAELDTVTPAKVIIPTDTTATSFDVGDELIADGISNFLPYMRIIAVLGPSSDGLSSPIFEGWQFQFQCVPIE